MRNFSQYTTYRSLLSEKQGRGFSEAEVKDILRQVLSQLTKLHDLKQAHGAISLDTVAYDSSRMHIVLLPDNGMSQPIYLAPEVAQTRQATPAADIYALGVFSIVLLTGLSPEQLKTPENEWDWEEFCTISNRFVPILNMALFESPDFRYINSGQMLRSLQRALKDTDLQFKTPTINPNTPEIDKPLDTPTLPITDINSPSTQLAKIISQPRQSFSELPTPELPDPESLIESLNIEPLDLEFNSSGNYSDTSIRTKADLPDSPTYKSTYKKTTDDRYTSKPANKGRIRGLLLILMGMGLTTWAVVTAYAYMQSNTQSKFTATTSQNIKIENVPSQSLVMESESARSEIARIEKAPKTDDNINKLISLAKEKYENSGSLTEAKTILQAIPANGQITKKNDQLLQQWQEDTKKNGDLIQKAETAIANGKWQQAIEIVKGVSPTPYWQQRGKKIAANARQQLDKKMVISEPVPPPYIAPPPPPEAIAPQEPSAPPREQPYYNPPVSAEPAPREYSPREPATKEAPPSPRDAN
ncbi:MAG: serine/threonine-protein kinase [Pseudanabaena sp. ELA645]|jgi:hypothetical protein